MYVKTYTFVKMAYFNMMHSFDVLKDGFIVNRITTKPYLAGKQIPSCMNNNPNVIWVGSVTSRYAFGMLLDFI